MKSEDLLVSIEGYLDKELSKGPNASSGPNKYHYQNYENIYNFFSLIVMNKSKEKVLCLPKFKVIYGDYVTRSAVVFDIKLKRYWIPTKAKKAIKHCMNSGKIRFIYCSLIIITDINKLSHANMIVIDLKKKTLERFEPYGWTLYYMKSVNEFMKHIFLQKLGIKEFKYLAPENISEKVGIQTLADSYGGMCVTISMLYLHMRILNPDIRQKQLIKLMVSVPKEKLKKVILRYAAYVEKTLKKHNYEVSLMNDEIYRRSFTN